MVDVYLNGIFDRILTKEIVEDAWRDQIDRLVSEHGFTRESAIRMCAIAEHFEVRRISEKAEYISEILKLALPYGLACDIENLLNKYYDK